MSNTHIATTGSGTGYPTLRGDEGRLFTAHSAKLRSIVGREVRTSQANLDDACSFAWLQMLRYQPERERLLAWLCHTAIREAIKLDLRAQRSCELVDAGEADVRHAETGNPAEDRLELLTAREAIVARLRAREAELLSLQVAGYSYTETAELQQITTRTVYGREVKCAPADPSCLTRHHVRSNSPLEPRMATYRSAARHANGRGMDALALRRRKLPN